MPCYSPITAYRARSLSENGKRPLVFNRKDGYLDMEVQIPCGQCIGCRLEYSRQWALRCVHESQMHQENSFITLTYNNENLPEDFSVCKKELQKFFKRLRKNTGIKIRYFACGEYGDKNGRPHYHALIFGYDFPDKVLHTKSNDHLLYTSAILDKCWQKKGWALIGDMSFESAAYVARYQLKKFTGSEEEVNRYYQVLDEETGEIIDRSPEFCLMSRRPGIGSTWFDKYRTDTDKDFVTLNGVKMSLPRFYDDLLEASDPAEFKERKFKRYCSVNRSDCTPERLRDREVVKKAQLSLLKRSLD